MPPPSPFHLAVLRSTVADDPADDGTTPTVAQIGVCSIDLYTGSATQQTFLQNLAASVDVSKASTVVATIDPTVGQSGTSMSIDDLVAHF